MVSQTTDAVPHIFIDNDCADEFLPLPPSNKTVVAAPIPNPTDLILPGDPISMLVNWQTASHPNATDFKYFVYATPIVNSSVVQEGVTGSCVSLNSQANCIMSTYCGVHSTAELKVGPMSAPVGTNFSVEVKDLVQNQPYIFNVVVEYTADNNQTYREVYTGTRAEPTFTRGMSPQHAALINVHKL